MTTIRLMFVFAAMFPALLVLIPQQAMAAETDRKVTLSYKFTSEGYEFGAMQVTRSPAERGGKKVIRQFKDSTMTLEANQQVKVSESAVFSRDGQIWEYAGHLKGKDTYDIRLQRDKDTLALELRENGKAIHNEKVPAADVDYTSQYLPMDSLDPASRPSYRLLNLDELNVVGTVLHKVGRERLTVSGDTFDCTVISLDAGPAKARKWMARDANGYWFAVKEEIHSSDGDFEMVLTKYRVSR